MGAGKQALNGVIDIAVMQSLNRLGEVKDCVKDYGMVIVDECHHVSAFSFEMILKNVSAKYVYGLTATPVRKDGHHPIIFMQCGSGIVVVFKSNIHQKFAVVDQKIVWYGSINLLSFGSAEESIMRLESSNIANELIRSIKKEPDMPDS